MSYEGKAMTYDMPVVPNARLLLDILLSHGNPEHIPVHHKVDVSPVNTCTCSRAFSGAATG